LVRTGYGKEEIMRDRTGWMRGSSGPQTIKGKKYNNLVEFHRGCQFCGKPFSIFVTEKIAMGHADSNSFGLRNCEEHRRGRIQKDPEPADAEALRMANHVMKEELEGLYSQVQDLKTRLAQYELPAAMADVAAQQTKMPWEG